MKARFKILIYFSLILVVFLIPFVVNYKANTFDKILENNFPTIKEEVKQEKDLEYFLDKYPNSDIVARVEIENTSINEPVVQSTDNDYYLNHNLNKREDNKGSTFLDYRVNSSSKKKLIYGHNSSTLTVPFKKLENYYDFEYYKKHPIIKLEMDKTIQEYQIFSVFIETSDWSYMKINFETEKEWLNHITYLKDNSFYDTGVKLTKDDEILILQTCSHHKDYKKYSKKYLLVIAKRVNV